MNDLELRELADAAAQVLRPHLERSEPLRRTVALIGKWLCDEAERVAADTRGPREHLDTSETPIVDPIATTPVPPIAPAVPTPSVEVKPQAPAVPLPLPMSSALIPLKIGDAVVHVPLQGTTEELGRARASIDSRPEPSIGDEEFNGVSEVDLKVVEERCRLKAAACRLFIEKRAAIADPDEEREVLYRLNEMIAKAKAMPSCFLWVFWRNQAQPDDAALLRIAENYDAQADAVALVRRIDEDSNGRRSEDEESAFHLLAEANSALRVALGDTWLSDDDRDQTDAHVWLRHETALRRVFIERHMTADDPANPANAAELRSRIKLAAKRLDERAAAAKGIKNALGQIKYHAGQILKGRVDDAPAHWAKIADGAKKLETMGVAPTDRRIAEAVGAAAAALWSGDAAGSGFLSGVVARALALARRADGDALDRASAEDREWSKAVLEVRGLLRGKRMVIIGGERNAPAVERLKQAFELKEAEWVVLTEHGSGIPMRAPIHRPDTAVVLVILKLTGHLHAEEAREYATAAGKPCVLLSGGYNPEKVAAEIVEQASTRLKQ